MQITIDTKEIKRLSQWLSDIEKKQIPYATARALNDTANTIREAEIKGAQEAFKVRGSWLRRGKYTFLTRKGGARKTENPMWQHVKSDADWLPLHVTGGTKERSGRIAIPQPAVKSSAKSPQKMTVARKAPLRERNAVGPIQPNRSVLRKTGGRKGSIFKLETGKKAIIFKRVGKKLTPLFNLVKKAKIKKEFDFYGIAQKTAPTAFNKHFADWLKKSVKPR